MITIKNHLTPHLFHRWNRAMQGAYRKGVKAYRDGEQEEDCPYSDIRKPSGLLSWSRAFQNAWREGWRNERSQHGRRERPTP